MKAHARSFSRLALVLALTLTLLHAVSAQTAPPSGSYGFLINLWLSPQNSDSGTAFLGVTNGTANFAAASGQSANSTFAFVVTDGGSELLLLPTNAPSGVPFGTARLQ